MDLFFCSLYSVYLKFIEELLVSRQSWIKINQLTYLIIFLQRMIIFNTMKFCSDTITSVNEGERVILISNKLYPKDDTSLKYIQTRLMNNKYKCSYYKL